MSGKEFRKWRRNQDITQEKIANMCDVDKSTISRWENDLINLNESTYNTVIDYMTMIEKYE